MLCFTICLLTVLRFGYAASLFKLDNLCYRCKYKMCFYINQIFLQLFFNFPQKTPYNVLQAFFYITVLRQQRGGKTKITDNFI